MNNYTKQLQQELLDYRDLSIFEIAVHTSGGDSEWITCDIFIQGNSIIAQREAVSTKELKSKFIASSKLVIDSSLSLYSHLQALYAQVTNDIDEGGLFHVNYGD